MPDSDLTAQEVPAVAEVVVPPLSQRLRVASRVAAAWMVLLGLAATIVGVHDLFAGIGMQAHVLGLLLLVNGVALVLGAVGLVRRSDIGLSLALVATLMSVALSVLVFLAQAINGELDLRLLAGGAIIAACGASALCIHAATPSVYRATSVRMNLPVLKSTLSIGLLVSVGQFWYSQIYLPSTKPPGLTLTTKVQKVGEYGGGYDVVQGSVELENNSGARVPVLSSTISLMGERITPSDVSASSFARDSRDVDLERSVWADRNFVEEPLEHLSYGHLVKQGTFYNPGETDSLPFVTLVPTKRYQGVLVQVYVMIGRSDRLKIDDQDRSVSATSDGVIWRTKLPESGWLERLTRGKRDLLITYKTDRRMEFAFDRGPGSKRLAPATVDRLSRVYGVSYLGSTSEVPLPD
jgi:hypothetical protein